MNYDESKEYIINLNKFGMKLGLERIEMLLSRIGNPEREIRSILVGGTNGKGSTVTMISSVLKEAGFVVGTFVKPHLFDFRERISVNGDFISENDFIRMVEKIKPFADYVGKDSESPTFFEVVTAVAFEYFREKKVDIVVAEVGLGGRLDATNVLIPDVSVITNVSLEHTDILGDTVEKISFEKGGIIKENGIVVTCSNDDRVLTVFRKLCEKKNAKLIMGKKLENVVSKPESNSFDFNGVRINVPLGGKYQTSNISCALSAVLSLSENISTSAIKNGLEKIKWPGRFEIISKEPTIILDGAKDTNSMSMVMESLDMFQYKKLYTVIGVSKDKLVSDMLKQAAKKTDYFIITKHNVSERGLSLEKFSSEVVKTGKEFSTVKDVKTAVRKAIQMSDKDDIILVTGSLFTVAEAREIWFPTVTKMGREFNENIKVN